MTATWDAEEAEARNPATPPTRLGELIGKHLDAVLQNPAFALLLLEHPDFWAALSPSDRREVAFSPACPESFASWALRQPEVPAPTLHVLTLNPGFTRATRRQALLGAMPPRKPEARALLRMEELLTTEELSLMERGGLARRDSAGHPDPSLDSTDLEQLSSLDVMGACLAASHPGCPAPLLVRLSDHANVFVFTRALKHPSVPAPVLARAMASPDHRRIYAATENPSLTPEQFQAAADSPARTRLVRNPNLPPDVLAQLLRDSDFIMRIDLARNEGLSPEAQLVLAADSDPEVLRHLKGNPKLTAEARARLDHSLNEPAPR